MVGSCIGAFVVGAIAAMALPVFPFLVTVLLAFVIGSAVAAWNSQPVVTIAWTVFGLLCCIQLGYVVGLGLSALTGRPGLRDRASRKSDLAQRSEFARRFED